MVQREDNGGSLLEGVRILELANVVAGPFAASLLATVSYYFAAITPPLMGGASWKKLARISFYIHSFSVVMIVATLFYMLFNHYYEYHYVWQHSNNQMPLRYIFSCFWEGQEGSFLLWTFWNVALGIILIRTLTPNSKPPPKESDVLLRESFRTHPLRFVRRTPDSFGARVRPFGGPKGGVANALAIPTSVGICAARCV